MNGQRVYHYWSTLVGRHVAETLNEHKVDYCLMVREPCVDRNINIIGLDRD